MSTFCVLSSATVTEVLNLQYWIEIGLVDISTSK